MGIKTHFICDKCKKDQDTDDQMWTVGIVVHHEVRYLRQAPNINCKQIWCRACIESVGGLGHLAVKPEKGSPVPVPPTLEDNIREIIREETGG